MAEKSTSMATISRLIIRELRQESNVQQAQIAVLMGKTPSAWSKVESGETPLTLDHLFSACTAMNIWPTAVLQTVQNYVALFSLNGWYVSPHGASTTKVDDALWVASDEFYAATVNQPKALLGFSILQTPWPYPNAYVPLRVFEYAITKHNAQVMGV